MTARAPGATIELAPGHVISRAAVRRKMLLLDDLSIDDVVGMIADIWNGISPLMRSLDARYFGSSTVSDAYRSAAARKDWAAADKAVLDPLARNRARYGRFLEAEEWMHAFTERLRAEAERACNAFRWMDPPELQSYLDGTFESKVEFGGTRRGFKALSLNPGLKFLSRPVVVRVPLVPRMRRSLRPVCYTALPRYIEEKNERIADPKNAINAREAEVRVPDGTAVPSDSAFIVKAGTSVDERVARALKRRYDVIR